MGMKDDPGYRIEEDPDFHPRSAVQFIEDKTIYLVLKDFRNAANAEFI